MGARTENRCCHVTVDCVASKKNQNKTENEQQKVFENWGWLLRGVTPNPNLEHEKELVSQERKVRVFQAERSKTH